MASRGTWPAMKSASIRRRARTCLEGRVTVAADGEEVGDGEGHLVGRRHQWGGTGNGEGGIVGLAGGEDREPSALAQAPEADAFGIDAGMVLKRVQGGNAIAGKVIEVECVVPPDSPLPRRSKTRTATPMAGRPSANCL